MLEIPIKIYLIIFGPHLNKHLIQVIFDSTETYYKPMPVEMKA